MEGMPSRSQWRRMACPIKYRSSRAADRQSTTMRDSSPANQGHFHRLCRGRGLLRAGRTAPSGMWTAGSSGSGQSDRSQEPPCHRPSL